VVYVAFFVSLGMLCTAHYPTTKQAATAALVIGLFATMLLPWAVGKALTAALPAAWWVPQQKYIASGRLAMPWPEQLAVGLTPAWAMRESVIPDEVNVLHWFGRDDNLFTEVWPFVVLGLAVYGTAAAVMARLAAARFRRSVAVARRPEPRYGGQAAPALAE